MQDQPSDADVKTERAVLAFVLQLHPTRLTQGELTRALAEDPEDFAQRDAIVRAVGARRRRRAAVGRSPKADGPPRAGRLRKLEEAW